MPRNGSGTMTPDVDFTTEAASPPIEISKLDQVLEDMADELTNSIAADGQTNPSADLKMNGFKHTNVGAASALNQYGRVTEIIDQDYIYYVDSGSANTLAITPSPAIAAYEEGQRFVVRAAANNSGATTLNVNALGAIAVQTPDGNALVSGAIISGGIYEFTYDANTSPDRWVLTSPGSNLPFGIAASDIVRLSQANTYTAAQTISATSPELLLREADAAANNQYWSFIVTSEQLRGVVYNDLFSGNDWLRVDRTGNTVDSVGLLATTLSFTGNASTPNTSSSEVGYKGAPSRDVSSSTNTTASDSGGTIRLTGGSGQTFTLDSDPPEDAFVIIDNASGNSWTIAASGTLIWATTADTGNRTLADDGLIAAFHRGSGVWVVNGGGLS